MTASADSLTLLQRAAEGSPAIVILCIGIICALAWFIRYLMALLEKKDERFAELQGDTLTALNANTNAVHELRNAIRTGTR